MGRPRTGQGKVYSVYLSLKRLALLGDDPIRAIYRLIDAKATGEVKESIKPKASELMG